MMKLELLLVLVFSGIVLTSHMTLILVTERNMIYIQESCERDGFYKNELIYIKCENANKQTK